MRSATGGGRGAGTFIGEAGRIGATIERKRAEVASIPLGSAGVTEAGNLRATVTAYSPRSSYSSALAALSATTWGTAVYVPEVAKVFPPAQHALPLPLHELHPADVGAAAIVGLSVAALYATTRAVRWKNVIRLHPRP